jgi:hypothetical protein
VETRAEPWIVRPCPRAPIVIALAALATGAGWTGTVGSVGSCGPFGVVDVTAVVPGPAEVGLDDVPVSVVAVAAVVVVPVEMVDVVVVSVVVVPVVVVPVVLVVLVVGGGDATTRIVAVMNRCRSQWNVYVPAALKVHVPLQPGELGVCGSGGTAPLLGPAVCVQLLGYGPVPKSALCALNPWG